MSQETERRVADFVSEWIAAKKPTHLDVSWFGGEPLLALNTIERLSERLIGLCEASGVKYISAMITNGTLLKEGAVQTLLRSSVSQLQITVDGSTIEEHDKRRPFRSLKGSSFSQIVKNIENLDGRISVTIRMNLDEMNEADSLDLLDFMHDKGWFDRQSRINVYAAPLEKYNSNCNVMDSSLLAKKMFAQASTQIGLRLLRYAPHLLSTPPRPSATTCGTTADWNFVINPNFNFTKCWQDTGEGVEDLDSWEFTVMEDRDCMECEIMPLCKGGCPAYRRKGNLPRVDWCDERKYNLQEKLMLVLRARQYEKNAEEVRLLSSRLGLSGADVRGLLEKISIDCLGEFEYWPIQRSPTASTTVNLSNKMLTSPVHGTSFISLDMLRNRSLPKFK
jgi:uncharacterized protein